MRDDDYPPGTTLGDVFREELKAARRPKSRWRRVFDVAIWLLSLSALCGPALAGFVCGTIALGFRLGFTAIWSRRNG